MTKPTSCPDYKKLEQEEEQGAREYVERGFYDMARDEKRHAMELKNKAKIHNCPD